MQYAILNTDKNNDYYGNIWGVYIEENQYLVTHSDTGYDKTQPQYTYNNLNDFLLLFSFVQ